MADPGDTLEPVELEEEVDPWEGDDDDDWDDEIEDEITPEGGELELDVPPSIEPPPSSEVVGGVSPPAPSLTADQVRIAELETQKRESDARGKQQQIEATLADLTSQAQKRYQTMIDQGTRPEAAQESAGNWLRAEQSALEKEVGAVQNRERDKELLALRLLRDNPAASYNELMTHDNPDTMKAAAKKSASDNEEVTELKARIAKLEGKSKTPQQRLARGGSTETTAPTNLQKKARSYGRRGGDMTTEEYNKWKQSR